MYPGLRVLKYQPRNALRRSGGPGGVKANAKGGRRRCVAQIRSAVVQRSWQGARARPWPRGQTPWLLRPLMLQLEETAKLAVQGLQKHIQPSTIA